MIIGPDFKTRQTKKQAKQEELYKLMVPRKTFAWLPKRLELTGQYVWLQSVWRFGGNYSFTDNTICKPTVFYYALSKEEAFELSKSYNRYFAHSSHDDRVKAAKELLGIVR